MNRNTLIGIALFIGIACSCLFHKNYFLFFLLISLFFSFQYTRPKYDQSEKKTKIKNIIENFDNTIFNFDSYDLYRFPKRFKYIYIKPDFYDDLINMRFISTYNKEAFMKMFIIIEKFLKTFYNIITNRYHKLSKLHTMKDLHQEFKKIHRELELSTPFYSKTIKRFGSKNLHHVINDNMLSIEKLMLNKIHIIQALIDGKIK